MELKAARLIAEQVMAGIQFSCERVEIAGSIRRCRPEVHDIDLVLIPSNQGQLLMALRTFGQVKGGAKILQCITPSITIDIYVATPATWVGTLLIRTGSKGHNIELCKRARQMGMVLHVDGRGLCNFGARTLYGEPAVGDDEPVDCPTEAAVFEKLELPYREPWERE